MDPDKVEVAVKSTVRFLFVLINNLYCIPVHIAWLLLLQPVKLFAVDLYWKIEGIFFRWLLSMVALWSYSAGYHIVEIGDDISDLYNKKALIMFNHQSTSDVPLIMAAFNSRPNVLDNIMWIMDKQFKRTNFGVVSVAHGDFFIRAGKDFREKSLAELRYHLRNFYIPRRRNWVILFPEGGFLKNRKAGSLRYAAKNDLPLLENVNYPRIGALKTILEEAASKENGTAEAKIKYIIDVTIAYPKGNPLNLLTVIGGWRPPCKIYFHYKKYSVDELPRGEEALADWANNLYIEKNKMLQNYYDTGFLPNSCRPRLIRHDPMEFVLRHLFFFTSTIMCLKYLTAVLYLIFDML